MQPSAQSLVAARDTCGPETYTQAATMSAVGDAHKRYANSAMRYPKVYIKVRAADGLARHAAEMDARA
jgi:hypothetical protein